LISSANTSPLSEPERYRKDVPSAEVHVPFGQAAAGGMESGQRGPIQKTGALRVRVQHTPQFFGQLPSGLLATLQAPIFPEL
jgi:hypothetical protein